MSKSHVENTDFILTGWQIVPAQIGNGFSHIGAKKESFPNVSFEGSLSYCPADTDEFFKIKKTIFLK